MKEVNQMETKHEQGVCPICGSEEITYGAIEVEGNSIYYPAECDKCHATWQEYYDLTFSGHYNIDKGE